MPVVNGEDLADCSICQEPKTEGSGAIWEIEPPCGHAFHQRCLAGWLVANPSATCPICRRGISASEKSDMLRSSESSSQSSRRIRSAVSNSSSLTAVERDILQYQVGESSQTRQLLSRMNNVVPRATRNGPMYGGSQSRSSIPAAMPASSAQDSRQAQGRPLNELSFGSPWGDRQEKYISIFIARSGQPIMQLLDHERGPMDSRNGQWEYVIIQAQIVAFKRFPPDISLDPRIARHANLLAEALTHELPRNRSDPTFFELVEAFNYLIQGLPVNVQVGPATISWSIAGPRVLRQPRTPQVRKTSYPNQSPIASSSRAAALHGEDIERVRFSEPTPPSPSPLPSLSLANEISDDSAFERALALSMRIAQADDEVELMRILAMIAQSAQEEEASRLLQGLAESRR